MFKILGKIPTTHFHVACSGGTDSMVLVDFLTKFPRNKFDILHFNHGTKYCPDGERVITEYCQEHGINIHIGNIKNNKPLNKSWEEYWRDERYAFFSNYKDEPILMAHHLNDCIETWIMTSMQGKPRLIPYHNEKYNIYRPFLCVPKTEIEKWITTHKLKCSVDKSNFDVNIPRNYVRHVMMNSVYRLNPGIEKTIKKLIVKSIS